METVDAGAPRGGGQRLARLRLGPAELTARTGLRLTPTADDTGPVVRTLVRLTGGELVGLTRAADDPEPGVDVRYYTGRPAHEVVAELLAETGLTHADLTWMSGGFPGARVASTSEAALYLTGNPDGPVEIDGEVARHGEQTALITGETVLDASQWQAFGRRCARRAAELTRAYRLRRPTNEEYEQADQLWKRAVECAAEVVRCVPEGAEEVPVRALWTAGGLRAARERPEDFRVPRIDRELARHRQARAEFAAMLGPPAAARTAARTPPLARSAFDASMFLDFQECRCGGRLIAVAEHATPTSLTVKARCARRTWHRYRFAFSTVSGAPDTPHWEMSDRRQPSHLVDPGEWLVAAGWFAGGNPERYAMTMRLAASCIEEAMLFVPPGANAIPADEVRSRRGRELYAEERDRFRWPELLAARDEYLAESGTEDPGPAVHPLPARSVNEAVLFIELHRCSCGTIGFRRELRETEPGEPARRELRYDGLCLSCRCTRVFVFTVPPEDGDPEPMGHGFSRPGDGPSALLDAGEFWTAGQQYEQAVAQAADRAGTLAALASSVAVYDEMLALVPDGAETVPEAEFRTPVGRTLHRRHPELFSRAALSAERDRRRESLSAFLAD